MQGGDGSDGQERVPQCLVRAFEGARRTHSAGQASVGHRGSRRVRNRSKHSVQVHAEQWLYSWGGSLSDAAHVSPSVSFLKRKQNMMAHVLCFFFW